MQIWRPLHKGRQVSLPPFSREGSFGASSIGEGEEGVDWERGQERAEEAALGAEDEEARRRVGIQGCFVEFG